MLGPRAEDRKLPHTAAKDLLALIMRRYERSCGSDMSSLFDRSVDYSTRDLQSRASTAAWPSVVNSVAEVSIRLGTRITPA